MTVAIDIKNLNCKMGTHYLLKDINWTVEKGSHWVVFGMNGSGKTTLLSIIAGMRAFNTGNLTVLGEMYTEENVLDLRKKIGFISSSFFDKVLSKEAVLDIVLSGKFGTVGKSGNVSNTDIKCAKTLLQELRLRDKIDRPFDWLSKGERQSVLVARAIMGNPEILVLDEPSTGLDVYAREYLINTVQDFACNTDATIIYVTHYVEEISRNLDNCLLMKNGQIYMSGKTEDIFTANNLSTLLNYPVQLTTCGNRRQIEMSVDSKIRIL